MRKKILTGLLILSLFGCNQDDANQMEPTETYKIFNASNSPLQGIITDGLNSLKIDETNDVWIATNSASGPLFKYSQSSDTWTVYGNESFGDSILVVYDIDFDQSNNVWVGTNDGVFMFDGVEWTSSLRSLFMGNPHHARNIHVDQSNKVWCTVGNELYKNENGLWSNVSESDALFPTQVHKIASDGNGVIWLGCYQGLIKYDGSSFTKIEHEPDIQSMNITDIDVVAPDNIWVGSRWGLHRWNGSNWETIDDVAFENPLHDHQEWSVSAIAVREERKLFGTWNIGLAINEGDEYHFMRGNEFGIDTNRFQINELEYDLSNNLWMATRPGKVIVYNENGLK